MESYGERIVSVTRQEAGKRWEWREGGGESLARDKGKVGRGGRQGKTKSVENLIKLQTAAAIEVVPTINKHRSRLETLCFEIFAAICFIPNTEFEV